MTSLLPNTDLLTLCLWLLGRRKRLKVVGNSMLPLLQPGEEILIAPHAYDKSQPKINDIVVVKHPLDRTLTIVKRVKAIASDGNYFLVGDNPTASTDSRHWGAISHQEILGKVTNRFS